jgi:hypothetical protein
MEKIRKKVMTMVKGEQSEKVGTTANTRTYTKQKENSLSMRELAMIYG